MSQETKNCQSCKADFTIEPEDFDFYKKIGVPPPTFCPECRNIRRSSWREFQTFYRGACGLCGKETMSMYHPDAGVKVYCRECYQSDKWDPLEYGREYDFSKPFFAQYRELMDAVPWPALTGRNLVNCEYSHACQSCKNCYLNTWSYFSQDSQYCYGLLMSRDSYDCYTADNSDHAYEALNVNRMFRTNFAYFSDDCLDSSFLYGCLGCSDCFGGVNLRKQKYRLFNEQLSKGEYAERVKEWDVGSYSKMQEAKARFRELYLSIPRKYAHTINAVSSTGDLLRDTKNCRQCFSVLDGAENCKYLYGAGLNIKDSMDSTSVGDLADLLYEDCSMTRCEKVFFSAGSTNAHDEEYSNFSDFSDLFGCIALKKKQYCILNRQYTREEYFEMVKKIRKHMEDMPYVDKKGRVYRYGEFFPSEISNFAYNESLAMIWYPKTKEEVLAEGLSWREPVERDYAVTIQAKDLPDHIRDINDGILKEIIGCLHGGKCSHRCATAFRITPQELSFYRESNLALPRLCQGCRFEERFAWRNGYKLWRRRCMCSGSGAKREGRAYKNTVAHFHGDGPCPNEFESAYAPERSEMVYCEQCYKAEFL